MVMTLIFWKIFGFRKPNNLEFFHSHACPHGYGEFCSFLLCYEWYLKIGLSQWDSSNNVSDENKFANWMPSIDG